MPPLAPRPARLDELPALVRQATRVFHGDGAPWQQMADHCPLLFARENCGNLIVIIDNGQPLAHAGFCLRPAVVAGRRYTAALLGAVFTSGSHRGQGLGSRVVAAAVTRARENGADFAIISGRRSLYERAGFAASPSLTAWTMAEDTAPSAWAATAPDSMSVRPFEPRMLPTLMALHDRETTRFERTAAQWRALLGSGRVGPYPGRVWLIETGARREVRAYAAIEATPRLERARHSVRAFEIGGERRALVAALPALTTALGHAVELLAPAQDEAQRAAATAAGLLSAPLSLPTSVALFADGLSAADLPRHGLDYV